MRIIVDSREQRGYQFEGPNYEDVEVEKAALVTGDYSLAGLTDKVACERKSIDDLVQSMGRARQRFEKELARGMALDAFAVVVEASFEDLAKGRYGPKMWPQAACQSVLAFTQRYRVPFLFAGNRAGGQYAVHGFLKHYLEDTRRRLDGIIKAHDKQSEVEDVLF